MVRHGEAPDPKADMIYPDGLGRVISGAGYSGAGYSGAGYSGAGYSGAGHFRAGYSPNTAPTPLVISFPANNALQQKHHAACPSTRLGTKYRPAIIR